MPTTFLDGAGRPLGDAVYPFGVARDYRSLTKMGIYVSSIVSIVPTAGGCGVREDFRKV
jgi:hypothetical protein